MYPFLKNKKIWLFMDRINVADDNAKYLFSYSINQNDGIDKYFLIDGSSKDYSEMKKINSHIVKFGSLKHKLLFLYSDKFISSHVDHVLFNPFYRKNRKLLSNLIKVKRCFLQHGVIKDDISSWISKFDVNLYLFLTSSDFERNSILEKNYNYDENVVKTLGLPRFDNLNGEADKKQILFAPTWRNYLASEKSFIESRYFKTLNSFFNNRLLFDEIKKNGYKLIFKPHYDILKYLHLLNIPEDVEIAADESYQDLFNSSSLMITDYSSVFFDFAYLKKPVIYYQADNDYHYSRGYFDYETMGFGEVIDSEKDLADKIIEYIKEDCVMENKYQKRVEKFFKYNDKNNCKRVYEWLYEN